MKKLLLLSCIAAFTASSLPAQVPTEPPPPPPAYATVAPVAFTPDQLDQLVGPIALYPDALIALMLPASTDQADLALAAQYLQSGGDSNQVDTQPWEDSVRALAHYPEVISWMDLNVAWTRQLGEQFVAQPKEVMNAIQRMRARARAAGTLVDTPQQQVVYEGNTIAIVPTQPDVIYVPYYDPAVVYLPRGYYAPANYYFGFSSGFACGWWLSFGLDWHDRCVWSVDHDERERYWREHRTDWNRRVDPPRSFGRTVVNIHTFRPREEFDHDRHFTPQARPPQGGQWSGGRHDAPRGPRDSDRPHDGRDRAATNPAPKSQLFMGPTGLRSPLPQPLPTPQFIPRSAQPNTSNSARWNREVARFEPQMRTPAAPPSPGNYNGMHSVPPTPVTPGPNRWQPTRPASYSPPAPSHAAPARQSAPAPQYSRSAPPPSNQSSGNRDDSRRRN